MSEPGELESDSKVFYKEGGMKIKAVFNIIFPGFESCMFSNL